MSKPYVIGFSGGSASGKSTIVDYLVRELKDYNVKAVHADEYYKEEAERPVMTGITDGMQYIDDNHPGALDLDKFYSDVDKAVAGNFDIVLLDGVFMLCDDKITPILNLKIYIDCDSDERLVRRIKRHLGFGQDFDEITQRYVQAVKQRHMEYVEPSKWKADIILNGFLMPKLGKEIILSWINKAVSEKADK